MQFHSFDQPYVERLCSGDFRTEEHFVAYFSELIHLKLRSRVPSVYVIEDLRQETFARVLTTLRSKSGIRDPERLGAFVNSVCNNVLLEYYRASSRDSAVENNEDAASSVADPAMDVVGVIAHKQTERKVQQILEDLPERDRRLLREVFLEERNKDEVCKEFGVDRDYLRVLLHRAKLAFKSLYLKGIAASAGNRAGE